MADKHSLRLDGWELLTLTRRGLQTFVNWPGIIHGGHRNAVQVVMSYLDELSGNQIQESRR